MNPYIQVLGQAAVIYPIIVVLFTIPYIAFNYHKYGSVLSLRVLIVYSFILYLLCVYCLVILPLPSPQEAAALQGRQAQLIPFWFVREIAQQSGAALTQPATWPSILDSSTFWVTFYNFFMTLPFGVYLRYYFCCGWKKALGLSFALTLFFELTQLSGLYFIYPGSYRLFDVDDLLVNTAGSMAGWALAGPVGRLLPSRQELDATSQRRGASVSLARRAFSFLVDCACAAVASPLFFMVSALVLGQALPARWLPLFLWGYFSLMPLLMGGQTPGKRLTRTRILRTGGQKAGWYQYPLRYGLLLAGVWGLPFLLDALLLAWSDASHVGALAAPVLRTLLTGGYLFGLFFALVLALLRKPLYYERWSRTQIVSTVVPAPPDQTS